MDGSERVNVLKYWKADGIADMLNNMNKHAKVIKILEIMPFDRSVRKATHHVFHATKNKTKRKHTHTR